MIQAYCAFITASGHLSDLVIGETLHAGFVPQGAPHLCTAVQERTPARSDKDNPALEEVHYQLLTRGPSYMEARAEARRIYGFCVDRKIGYTLGSSGDLWTLLTTTGIAPAYLGQDEKGRFMFSANLTLRAKKEN